MPVYSGGLGILAGDHLKRSSDFGLPLCGVSLMYREGYFRQYLNADGWQQERYPENDFFTLPLIAERARDGTPLVVSAPLPGRDVKIKVWRIQVGRVPLYLLDANIPENSPDDRAITAQLYGGDTHTRIQQEIVLGIGGIRALRAVGHAPTVCHMNEGHSAFCSLERIRLMRDETGCDFATASEAVKAGTCFTTHTPVPAGNDAFPIAMVEQYLGDYLGKMGIDRAMLATLGRQEPAKDTEPFGMTVLALKLANVSNGVSKLHGDVSRAMWNPIWPTLPVAEVPIASVTNGVHTQTWVSPELGELLDRYVGVPWDDQPTDFAVWKRVDQIPDSELWRTHARAKQKLVAFARARLKAQALRRGASPAEVHATDELLDPEALTIGFARRFATYKRGDLLFRDAERLVKLLNHAERPVQFIFAGKAHPKDTGGKELIARVVQMAKRPEFRKHVVFVEDYDMNVARHLVQGVDVWLNNPRRPLEASGTSGMKVAVQRRPEPVDPRRLVVRRVRRRQRLGHRGGRGVRRRPEVVSGRRRESGPVRPARTRHRPRLLPPRRRRRPPRLDPADEEFDPDPHAGLQHESHGRRVRREQLHALARAVRHDDGRGPGGGERLGRVAGPRAGRVGTSPRRIRRGRDGRPPAGRRGVSRDGPGSPRPRNPGRRGRR